MLGSGVDTQVRPQASSAQCYVVLEELGDLDSVDPVDQNAWMGSAPTVSAHSRVLDWQRWVLYVLQKPVARASVGQF